MQPQRQHRCSLPQPPARELKYSEVLRDGSTVVPHLGLAWTLRCPPRGARADTGLRRTRTLTTSCWRTGWAAAQWDKVSLCAGLTCHPVLLRVYTLCVRMYIYTYRHIGIHMYMCLYMCTHTCHGHAHTGAFPARPSTALTHQLRGSRWGRELLS